MAKTKKSDEDKKKKEERKNALASLSMPYDGWDEEEKGHEPYIKKDKRGRPSVMTKQVLRKLREAFAIGCPDEEACIWAGIGPTTLYDYCREHPEFSQEKEEIKQTPVLVARNTVFAAIKRDTAAATWYLTRKRKKEFAEAKLELDAEEVVTADDLEALDRGDIHLLNEGVIEQTKIKAKNKRK